MSNGPICPSKLPPIDQGLREFQTYIDNNYGSYDEFKNDLLAQLSSQNLSPEIEALIRERLNDPNNPFNPGNYINGVNEFLSGAGLAGVGDGLGKIADNITTRDLFEFGTLQSVKEYAKGYTALGIYIGVLQAGNAIYNSDDKLSETGKQLILSGTGLLVGAGVAAGLAVAAPIFGIGAAGITIGSAIFGGATATVTNNYLSSKWDDLFNNIENAKLQGLGKADAIERAALDLLEDVEDLFESGAFGDTPLNNSNNPFCIPPDEFPPVPDWLHSAGGEVGNAPNVISPLVLDIDGDGVETSAMGYGMGGSTTYFDIDNDGFAERTGWAAGGDGLLAFDKNNNGRIDNQSELFGNSPAYADGFAALKTLDVNNDNRITSADAQWNNLRVWIDADNDGVTDTGELRTLSSLNITQISLTTTRHSNLFNNENPVTASSTFTMNGQSRTVSDVWFRSDQMDTRFTGDYTLDPRTLFLPIL